MSMPYIGFSNDTLAKLPTIAMGETVRCHKCEKRHPLQEARPQGVTPVAIPGRNATAPPPPTVLGFFHCPTMHKDYLGSINGHNVTGIQSDISGKIPT